MLSAGTIFLTNYPAAGLTTRDPDRALAAGLYRCALDITYLMYGICRECAGTISSSVTVCDAHERQEGHPCTACGTPFPVWAEMRCETCGFAKRLPVETFATGLTMATGLIGGQAMDIQAPSFEPAIDVLQNRVETTVSEDPLRIPITLQVETASVSLTLDGDMNVVDLDRSCQADVSSS